MGSMHGAVAVTRHVWQYRMGSGGMGRDQGMAEVRRYTAVAAGARCLIAVQAGNQ